MYGEPLTFWQRIILRFQPTPKKMAEAELKAAELDKLQALSAAEYAHLRMHIYEITADYHNGRIERLKTFLGHDKIGACQESPYPGDMIELVHKHGDQHPGY